MTLLFVTVLSLNSVTGELSLTNGETVNVNFITETYCWQGQRMYKEELRKGDLICIYLEEHPYFDDQVVAKTIIMGPPSITDQAFIWAQESWALTHFAQKKINDYRVRNLGAKTFWTRERATKVLEEMGREAAYPLLIQGSLSDDSEIRDRSNMLLDKFWLRGDYETANR